MSYSEEVMEGFFNAAESMKKYRRADLIDEKGRSVLEELYVDLLPNEHILKKTLLDNTTFLVGRKGTGKSTLFLRLEQELRKKDNYLSSYLDVKTIYEGAESSYTLPPHLREAIPDEYVKKYMVERTFIKNVLSAIQVEITKKYNKKRNVVASALAVSRPDKVKEKLDALSVKINDDSFIRDIELPALREIKQNSKVMESEGRAYSESTAPPSVGIGVGADGAAVDLSLGGRSKEGSNSYSKRDENEYDFSSVFLRVFQIKEIIIELKEILSLLKIDHLFIILDDFSEITDEAISLFVDVVLAPLNNWSEDFIKFKVAAYPGRIYYGKIDPGKVDTIYLDFYNLYSEFDRNKMEENAVDFTKRLIEGRLNYYSDLSVVDFFDTSQVDIEEYYSLFFRATMNVPRIIGYLFSYCYQSKIIYGKKINKTDIEVAAERYFEDKIEPFFDTTTLSLSSYDEKISTLQLRELLESMTGRLGDIKKRISIKDLKGDVYLSSTPYASHFHFDTRLESFLKTLELNYFISKYNDQSDKDGKPVSVYCINYGLAKKLNIPWGKPEGNIHRKYFIERPFSFTKIIKDFLEGAKSIECCNPECKKVFSIEELTFLEFTNFKCNSCGSDVTVNSVSPDIVEKLKAIESKTLMPYPELRILRELERSQQPMRAKEIAQEIDYSGQLIGWRGKKLEEEYGYVSRDKTEPPFFYKITDEGIKYFEI